MNRIIAYTAEIKNKELVLTRTGLENLEMIITNDYCKALHWLTENNEDGNWHLTWDLEQFASTIFTFLPEKNKEELLTKTTIYPNRAMKIFYTGRWLAIDTQKYQQANFFRKVRNNFFGISNWFQGMSTKPDIKTVMAMGEELINTLEKMGLKPTKLTSPIGIYEEQLPKDLPTIFSNPKLINIANYCLPIMREEWRETFRSSLYAPGYHYDLTSAYPYFIRELPDTNYCIIPDKEVSNIDKNRWGICKIKIIEMPKVSPISKEREYATTEEVTWLAEHGAKFIVGSRYWIHFTSGNKPYEDIVNKLIQIRKSDDKMVSQIAKRIAQGLSGKLDQENRDGTLGDFYNPIYALIVRSRCRLAVANFIYENKMENELVRIEVDSVSAFKKVELPGKSEPGEWRITNGN